MLLVGIGLSADAFAASVCRGLAMKRINYRAAALIAVFFGAAQAVMPLAGWAVGSGISEYMQGFAHIIAFVLLLFIGAKTIYDAFCERSDVSNASLGIGSLAVTSLATAVDALAVGLAFSLADIKIIPTVTVIGVTTYLLCFVGVIIGNNFGTKYTFQAKLCGGAVLIIIGIKILIDGLM